MSLKTWYGLAVVDGVQLLLLLSRTTATVQQWCHQLTMCTAHPVSIRAYVLYVCVCMFFAAILYYFILIFILANLTSNINWQKWPNKQTNADAFEIAHIKFTACSARKFLFICIHTCINIATLSIWMCVCVYERAGNIRFPLFYSCWYKCVCAICTSLECSFVCCFCLLCCSVLSVESFVRFWKTMEKIFGSNSI